MCINLSDFFPFKFVWRKVRNYQGTASQLQKVSLRGLHDGGDAARGSLEGEGKDIQVQEVNTETNGAEGRATTLAAGNFGDRE